LKRVLEKIRADVGRVLSTRLGLKPKSFHGLMMRAGPKWKKVRPHHLGPDPEFPVGDELEPGSELGLGHESTEMSSTMVQGDLLRSMESIAEASELAPLIFVVFDGFSDVPREGFTLVILCPASPLQLWRRLWWHLFLRRWRKFPLRLIGNILR
jgi:hypothetical protein